MNVNRALSRPLPHLAARFWHVEWFVHTRRGDCLRCENGAPCRVADEIATKADDYGCQVMLADARARQMAPIAQAPVGLRRQDD